MKHLYILITALIFNSCLVTPAASQNIEDRKYVCMMQDALQVKPGIPIEIGGKTYFGCCPMCSGKMKSNPARFTKAKDPVSGALVDKAEAYIFAKNGTAYYFESEATRRKFSDSPEDYLK